jgi:very-short-patch-repair endonuclease
MRKLPSNLSDIHPLKARRRELRNTPTPAEIVLWRNLQRRQLLGKKFRRQFSIGKYVVDFFCSECNLAVELDGASHYSILREDYEAERTEYLEGLGVRIVRFENRLVSENIEGVLEAIRAAVRVGEQVSDLPRLRREP